MAGHHAAQSCLQATFEAETLNHARYMFDMMLPFTPIFAALSQNAPIQKGKLIDWDLRYKVITLTSDDRTEEE